jgi:rhamnogalacturonan endolyase
MGIVLLSAGSAQAHRYMEKLGRGVVAVNQGSGKVYVGWRMLGTDPETIAFNLYRNDTKVNNQPITDSTNYVDNNGSTDAFYSVRAVIDGREQKSSESVKVWEEQYLTIPLRVPPGPYISSKGYTPGDASAGDLNGDGEYEIVLKWEDNPQDNANDGFTNSPILDAYKLDGTLMWRINLGINIREGAHYTQFMVYDLDGDGKAEVSCKTADGTVDGLGNVIGNPTADYRNSAGRILSGPEFLTIFDGRTGAAMATVNFLPDRVNVSQWGDSYGNRVDRFLAAVAYIDGVRPSLIMCRGYYGPQSSSGQARNEIAAWNWRNGRLTHLWTFKAGYNINNDINRDYIGQGNHSLSVADVDGDGRDEIIYGACCIDDNGTGLYTTGLGHGDAMHVSDMDPDRPGLEVWQCHEGGKGATFRDVGTGSVIFAVTNPDDVGRACAADITADYRGYELWASTGIGLYDCKGNKISSTTPSINFVVWWDADLLREILNSNKISKYGGSTLLTASGCSSINGTKSTPCLQADLFGDWREEVVWKTSDNSQLRIYTTIIPTNHRIYTLMHDPVYRLGIAWQNVAYNQPPHTSFYMGDGMAAPPRPNIVLVGDVYGDLTGDNIVNAEDLFGFFKNWLEHDCDENMELDMNGDCAVNLYEFSLLALNWLEGIE